MKIIIIGIAGAGKSTLARRLADNLNLPVLHLDTLWHATDYSAEAERLFREKQQTFINSHEHWLIDGNYSGSLDERLPYVDKIIWLKMSRFKAIFRVMKRSWAFHKNRQSRPEMPSEFTEKLDSAYLDFLKFVWDFPQKSNKRLAAQLDQFQIWDKVVVLKNQREIEKYLTNEAKNL
jgi:adenylate kinase family enzyme